MQAAPVAPPGAAAPPASKLLPISSSGRFPGSVAGFPAAGGAGIGISCGAPLFSLECQRDPAKQPDCGPAPAGPVSHDVQSGRYRCWLQNGTDGGPRPLGRGQADRGAVPPGQPRPALPAGRPGPKTSSRAPQPGPPGAGTGSRGPMACQRRVTSVSTASPASPATVSLTPSAPVRAAGAQGRIPERCPANPPGQHVTAMVARRRRLTGQAGPASVRPAFKASARSHPGIGGTPTLVMAIVSGPLNAITRSPRHSGRSRPYSAPGLAAPAG